MALGTQKRRKAGLSQGGMTVSANPAKPAAAGKGLNRSAFSKGGAAYQGRTDNVADVAAGMMGKDSPLMQRAAAKGRAVANQRGLMNSSMAAQASTGAALDQIVPMASQTAGQEFQKNRAGQDFQINSESAWRDEGIADRGAERDFGYASDLSKQESGQRINETDAEYAQRMNLSKQESGQRINETAAEYAERMKLTDREGEIASNLSAQESEQRIGETDAEYRQRMKLSSQEAGQLQDQTKLEYGERRGLSAQEAAQARSQTRLEGSENRLTDKQSSALRQEEAKQQYSFDRGKMQLDGDIQARLKKQGFDYDKSLQDMEQDFQARQSQLDRSLEQNLASKKISADMARGAEASVNNTFSDYTQTISGIMSNPDLSAKERRSQINAAKGNMTKRMDMLEAMYDINFKWPGTGGADSYYSRNIKNIGK